ILPYILIPWKPKEVQGAKDKHIHSENGNEQIENLDFVFFNHILIISRRNTGRGSIIHLHHFTNHNIEVNKPSTDERIETLPHQRLSWAATSDLLFGEFFSGELKSRFDGNNEDEEEET
ncbi:unnamed protein product, partial [Brassica oleracea]